MTGPTTPQTHSGVARLFFVVERDPHMRRLITEFLVPLCSVRFFDDGATALEVVRRSPPSVVVTDLFAPKLDGLALCRLIKGEDALRGVKVVILSSIAARERAQQAGADAFLDKPIERDGITSLVRMLTGVGAAEERA
jgi:CheY-like chemotaxis protein